MASRAMNARLGQRDRSALGASRLLLLHHAQAMTAQRRPENWVENCRLDGVGPVRDVPWHDDGEQGISSSPLSTTVTVHEIEERDGQAVREPEASAQIDAQGRPWVDRMNMEGRYLACAAGVAAGRDDGDAESQARRRRQAPPGC